ncbi:MAG: solute:sodium symporter family transporter [Fibrobacteres bacterium]|nr:solute:sodium symporter family transporter [Fibrobacterota bacterium]
MFMIILISFLAMTGFVALGTWLITRHDDHKSSDGFFLAGRSLTFPVIAGSLLLTNLSTEQMVGLNGSAFMYGLSVMAWEVVAVIALVAMAIYFLPRLLKSGVTTIPQFMQIRFDHTTQSITNFIFLFAYAAILLPIILYTGATGLIGIMDIQGMVGMTSQKATIWLIVLVVGIIGSIYALWGGLRTVAVSDTLNGIGLLTGGFMITYFGLQAVSGGKGWLEGWAILKDAIPEKLNSVGGFESSVPFGTIFTGVMLLNLFYWTTNQQIIQRTLGAKSLVEGQKGVFLTGALKLLGPMYLVLPGLMAFYLFSNIGIKPDHAYGMLVNKVLPPYLTGFFAAVMMGAILSSYNSALNSTCTLFSLGFYKDYINRNATEEQIVKSGKWFGLFMAIVSMSIAPLLMGQESIYGYLQKMNGIYFIPIFAVFLMGLLNKKTPPLAAKVGLIAGLIIISGGYFIPPVAALISGINEFHFLGIAFLLLLLIMGIITVIKPLSVQWIQQDSKAVDLQPWKYAKHISILLVILVLLIYWLFADFKVLK